MLGYLKFGITFLRFFFSFFTCLDNFWGLFSRSTASVMFCLWNILLFYGTYTFCWVFLVPVRNDCWFLLNVKVEPLSNYLTSVEQSPTTTDDVDEILTWLLKLPLVSDGAAVTKTSSSFLLDLNIFFFFPTLNQLQKLQLLWLCDKETAPFFKNLNWLI